MGTRRRTLLGAALGLPVLAAGAGAAVWEGVLPGRARVRRALGIGQVDAAVPDAGGGAPRYAGFDSAARGRRVEWGWALPPGREPAGLPVVLVLHGRGAGARAAFADLGAHQFLAAHVAGGGAPFALASIDGGSTYWHPRRDGDDPLAMLTGELLPRLAGLGLSVARYGVLGWSMGGFGALLLAREAGAGRLGGNGTPVVCAASSPALFASAGATSPGSFDDAADFERWGALARDPGAGDVALSVSCGSDDPFCEQTRRYRASCSPPPAGGIGDGAHDVGYWRSRLPEQLAFLGSRLAA